MEMKFKLVQKFNMHLFYPPTRRFAYMIDYGISFIYIHKKTGYAPTIYKDICIVRIDLLCLFYRQDK